MNWVVFGVLLGFALFNLLGVALFHWEWKADFKDWKTNKHFWTWTVMLLLFGTAYTVLRFILFLKGLFE